MRDIDLEPDYRSDYSNIIKDFYIPCLSRSSKYRRAVGYFTSSGLTAASKGIEAFIEGNGRMLLVANPFLLDKDIAAMKRGYLAREDAIEKALIRQIAVKETSQPQTGIGYLAWLIAEGRLDVRIALPVDEEGNPRQGIYHEKLGIFSNESGDVVAFSGSANETQGGLIDNFESIDVFWSWGDTSSRVKRKVKYFERLWANETKGLEIYKFPEAAQNEFLKAYSKRGATGTNGGSVSEPGAPYGPSSDRRWRHQDEAIAVFLKKERGILEMATGTGKTRTALRIAAELFREESISTILIATDGNDLLDQWYLELLGFVNNHDFELTITRHHGAYHDRERFILNPQKSILLISRENLAPALRSLKGEIAVRTLLIHDEVHKLGSAGNRKSLSGLSDTIRYRLGLSATPERVYDEEGTNFINTHIGPVVFTFEINDAIKRGILSPFNYYPLHYEPDENDLQRIQQVYKLVAARKHAGNPMAPEEIWIALARVHKTSRAKLPVFRIFIGNHDDLLKRCIIFVEEQEYGNEVLEIVHEYRHDFHTYYSGEEPDILRRFATGQIECLITCHRLSEGIDIQSLTSVVLFSSARTRLETIQRMGRCLRTNPDAPYKRSHVVDFIRKSDNEDEANPDTSREEWLTELSNIDYED